jgi:hypothetical protein
MRKVFVFIILNSLLAGYSAWGSSGAAVLLNSYLSELAARQLEMLLPRGQFSLQVKVTPKKAVTESIRLPLGTTMISGDELSTIETSGSESMGLLLSRIEKMEVSVGVAKTVPESIRQVIKTSLSGSLALQEGRGDVVTFSELPEALATVWAPPPVSKESMPEPKERTSLNDIEIALAGIAGGFLLLAAFIIFFAFRQTASRLSSEARIMAAVLKEALESSSAGGNSFQMPATRAATPQTPTTNGSVASDDSAGSIWDKVDNDSVIAFCIDCLDHPQYRSMPGLLIDSILDSDRSEEVRAKLSPLGYEAQNIAGVQYPAREVTSLFQAHQPEYRRITRSPMSKQLLQISFDELVEFAKSSESVQSALLINSLTPLRRALILKVLPVELKLQLASVASQPMSMVEHKTHELALTSQLEKLGRTDRSKESQVHSMSFLSQIILRAETFEDDELFHKSVSKASGTTPYFSVLQALESFEAQDWETENLQELALAFCGYSQDVKAELVSKFSGKRQDWFKNFLGKFENSRPHYASPPVFQVHERIKDKLRAIRASEVTGEKNAAA